MLPLLRLIRWKNLCIVALTMYGLFFYFHGFNFIDFKQQLPFHLLVLAIVLITGAGNVINDYFDVDADKINKSDRLIVSQKISIRDTLRIYQFLNFIAIGLLFVSSYLIHAYFNLFLGLIVISLLLLYSKNLKRKGFIGNVLVSLLVAFIPIWSMLAITYLYFEQFTPIFVITNTYTTFILDHFWIRINDWSFPIFLSILSFIINLIREIVKDIEDIEGDKAIQSRSLAIRWGQEKVFKFILPFLLITAFYLLLGTITSLTDYNKLILSLSPLVIVAFILLYISYQIIRKKVQLRQIDHLLKINLLIGALLPYFWYALL